MVKACKEVMFNFNLSRLEVQVGLSPSAFRLEAHRDVTLGSRDNTFRMTMIIEEVSKYTTNPDTDKALSIEEKLKYWALRSFKRRYKGAVPSAASICLS